LVGRERKREKGGQRWLTNWFFPGDLNATITFRVPVPGCYTLLAHVTNMQVEQVSRYFQTWCFCWWKQLTAGCILAPAFKIPSLDIGGAPCSHLNGTSLSQGGPGLASESPVHTPLRSSARGCVGVFLSSWTCPVVSFKGSLCPQHSQTTVCSLPPSFSSLDSFSVWLETCSCGLAPEARRALLMSSCLWLTERGTAKGPSQLPRCLDPPMYNVERKLEPDASLAQITSIQLLLGLIWSWSCVLAGPAEVVRRGSCKLSW
jgi:hypothetical protein